MNTKISSLLFEIRNRNTKSNKTHLIHVRNVIDGGFQVLRHVVRQCISIVVQIRHPVVNLYTQHVHVSFIMHSDVSVGSSDCYLVQLQENARLPFGEAVRVFGVLRRAATQVLRREFAHFARVARIVVVAFGAVLALLVILLDFVI